MHVSGDVLMTFNVLRIFIIDLNFVNFAIVISKQQYQTTLSEPDNNFIKNHLWLYCISSAKTCQKGRTDRLQVKITFCWFNFESGQFRRLLLGLDQVQVNPTCQEF